jgi:hypothetical protein
MSEHMNTPTTPTPAASWPQRVAALRQAVADLAYQIGELANSTPSAVELAELVDLRRRLGIDDANPAPAQAEKEKLRAALANQADSAAASWGVVVGNVDRLIGSALDQGQRHDSLIRSADFRDGIALLQHGGAGSGGAVTAIGLIDALDSGHPLRGALPPGAFYKADGRADALVLGPATPSLAQPGSYAALKFYFRPPALLLTAAWRNLQVRQEAERTQEEERKRLWREAERRQSPQHRLDEIEKRLAQLGK